MISISSYISDKVLKNEDNLKVRIDYASDEKKAYVKMELKSLLTKINKTLKMWEQYGYIKYFIGDGTV